MWSYEYYKYKVKKLELDNLKLNQGFTLNKTIFLINLNKDKYVEELNTFYEFHKEETNDEIIKLLNEGWVEAQDAWSTWAIKELFKDKLIEEAEKIDFKELGNWYREYISKADSETLEGIYLGYVNDQDSEEFKEFITKKVKELSLVEFQEQCFKYSSRKVREFHKNLRWVKFNELIQAKDQEEFLEKLSNLSSKDLKQFTFEILDLLSLEDLKQRYLSSFNLESIEPGTLKAIFLKKLRNFLRNFCLDKEFEHNKKIVQELDNFYNLFLIKDNEINEGNLESIINLIYLKTDDKTEPFLSLIKWCWEKIGKNLSEEDIEYIKSLCKEPSDEEMEKINPIIGISCGNLGISILFEKRFFKGLVYIKRYYQRKLKITCNNSPLCVAIWNIFKWL